jgi:hypothetical protein
MLVLYSIVFGKCLPIMLISSLLRYRSSLNITLGEPHRCGRPASDLSWSYRVQKHFEIMPKHRYKADAALKHMHHDM